jgi:predicted glycosyltransferase
LSVSQIGYNSAIDLLVSGAPALVVPFTGDGNETEQGARAARLHQQGRVVVLDESVLTPAALASAVDDLLEGGPARFKRQSCEGAKATAQYLKRWLAE